MVTHATIFNHAYYCVLPLLYILPPPVLVPLSTSLLLNFPSTVSSPRVCGSRLHFTYLAPLLTQASIFVPWVRPYMVSLSVQGLSYEVDNQGIGIQFPTEATDYFFTAFSPTLEPTQQFIQWVTGVKRLGRESDHSPPSNAENFMSCCLMKHKGRLTSGVRALACCFLCFHPAARGSTEYWGIGVTSSRIYAISPWRILAHNK
jgi:hypothetical protein